MKALVALIYIYSKFFFSIAVFDHMAFLLSWMLGVVIYTCVLWSWLPLAALAFAVALASACWVCTRPSSAEPVSSSWSPSPCTSWFASLPKVLLRVRMGSFACVWTQAKILLLVAKRLNRCYLCFDSLMGSIS